MTNTIEQEVMEAIAEQLSIKPGEIKPESDLVKDLGADSLDFIDLFMNFEKKYNLEIYKEGSDTPDEDTQKLRTVRDVAEYIEGKLEYKHKIQT